MNTTTALAAKSLSDVRWMEDGKVAEFSSSRTFGVTDGAGRWLTFGGTRPGAWNSKAVAAEIAATVSTADVAWVEAL